MAVGDFTHNMSWARGRLLESYRPTGSSSTFGYGYDRQGLRTSKVVDGSLARKYFYEGSKLVAERWVDGNGRVNYFHYQYDAGGLCGVVHEVYSDSTGLRDTTEYVVFCDTFGTPRQVRRLSDNSVTAEFVYDAWGRRTATAASAPDFVSGFVIS